MVLFPARWICSVVVIVFEPLLRPPPLVFLVNFFELLLLLLFLFLFLSRFRRADGIVFLRRMQQGGVRVCKSRESSALKKWFGLLKKRAKKRCLLTSRAPVFHDRPSLPGRPIHDFFSSGWFHDFFQSYVISSSPEEYNSSS